MSANQQLSHHGDDENDGTSDILYTKQLREGKPNIDFTLSSEINKKLLKKETWIRKDSNKSPSVQPASAHVSVRNALNMIDTIDRPANAIAESTYAESGTYAVSPENKPGKRIPKAGAFAAAGVGLARAECSIFEAEAKGPNAFAIADASLLGAEAMARAEIASASAQAGPLGVTVGLGVDTGVSAGVDGLEVRILGTGFSIGPRTSVSILGSEVSCSII
ncbi:uncharacterized protein LOC113111328 [Carassius auratus]|uniref:Uncharacterized protein LOC113111328 n=1 Tax=Carassius auratus TaxID=7957 RepID=A0A6P6QDW2_CARAU|nr:uncharacterized protein LOC113111328 [Carassius auratus]